MKMQDSIAILFIIISITYLVYMYYILLKDNLKLRAALETKIKEEFTDPLMESLKGLKIRIETKEEEKQAEPNVEVKSEAVTKPRGRPKKEITTK